MSVSNIFYNRLKTRESALFRDVARGYPVLAGLEP